MALILRRKLRKPRNVDNLTFADLEVGENFHLILRVKTMYGLESEVAHNYRKVKEGFAERVGAALATGAVVTRRMSSFSRVYLGHK